MNTVDLIHKTAGENPVYNLFDNNNVKALLADKPIEKTLWRDGIKSDRSLTLKSDNTHSSIDLIHTFDLDSELFPDKFEMAISGDGQEHRRIRTLHSSSLISLLCFYGVSDKNPLIIDIEHHRMRFTVSRFEVKNDIGYDDTGSPHQSNMDVVLTGEDMDSGKKVVFFLESKFSEYLSWGKHSEISSRVYWRTYAQLFNGNYLERMGLKTEDTPGKPGYFDLMSRKGYTRHYVGGIKQMISHFLGVKNVADNEHSKDCEIYLGEILFKFDETIDPNGEKFKDYTGLYEILAEGLNDLAESQFKVVNKCLTYQDVFRDFNLDKAVRTFYSL